MSALKCASFGEPRRGGKAGGHQVLASTACVAFIPRAAERSRFSCWNGHLPGPTLVAPPMSYNLDHVLSWTG